MLQPGTHDGKFPTYSNSRPCPSNFQAHVLSNKLIVDQAVVKFKYSYCAPRDIPGKFLNTKARETFNADVVLYRVD